MRIFLNFGVKILNRQQRIANNRLRILNFSTQRMEKKSLTTAMQEAVNSNAMLDTDAVRSKGVSNLEVKVRQDPAIKKIDTPEFRGLFTEELRELLEIFKKYEYEVRIAGGAVRDILMHMHPKDIDLATTATPDQMKSMFTKEEVRMINAKGEKHGTITARIGGKENFEITTLRIDVVTDGRHAEVQFTTDWQLDANRRDLTINSMFLGFDGTLYDYFYGYEDLEKRRVVFVGNADTRIKEDFLRILRYFRFYGRIASEPDVHDAETLKAIKLNIEGLQRISGERIWTELQKIVRGNYNRELVLKMLECGISQYVGLPNEPNILEFGRFYESTKGFQEKPHSITYLVALLHDSEDAMHLHERLKLSAFERDLALFITQQRDKVDAEYKLLIDYQKLCLHPYAKREYVEELLKYSGKRDLYDALKSWKMPQFPVNGLMLKEAGCPQGRLMGEIMSQLKLIWANSGFSITKDELLSEHLVKILEELKSSSPEKPQRKKSKKRKAENDANSSSD